MPFYLSESLYEGPNRTNAQDQARPNIVRRQAYWSILSGSTGHIYGALLYLFPSNWRELMDLPGAFDMAHVSNFFNSFEWAKLIPDQNHTFVTSGFGTYNGTSSAGDNYVTSALSSDGKIGVSYFPHTGTETRTLTVAMGKLTGSSVTAKWFNPSTGVYTTISGSPFANSGSRNFTTPGDNGDNSNDWVLFLDARPTTPIVNSYIRFEAESASESAPLVEANDANASAGKFVWNPSGAINNTPVARASYTFTVTQAGTYKVWGRAITPTAGDSYWVKVDGGSWIKWNQIAGGTATNWTWDDVHNADNANQVVTFNLSAGSHTLQISEREAGTKLDKWLITNDMGYTPSGLEGSSVPPTYLWIETESATELSPLVEASDANASGGKYVGYLSGGVNNTAVSRASYSFSVTNAGTYKVWGRAQTPAGGNSFWIRMDGGSWIKWNGITGATATGWGWDDVHDDDNAAQVMMYTLSAGTHTLELSEREAGTKLDKWLITNDLSFTPTGTGGAALRIASGEVTSESEVEVYPNPADKEINVSLYAASAGEAKLVISSMEGRSVKGFSRQVVKGLNKISLPTGDVKNGIYLLNIQSGNKRIVRKVIITR